MIRSISAMLFKHLMLMVFVIFCCIRDARAERWPVIGIGGGYTHISGYYEEKLTGGGSALLIIQPYVWKYLLISFENDFSFYPLSGVNETFLFSYSFSLGPYIYYSISKHFSIFAGTLFKTSVFYIDALEINRQSTSLKIGMSLNAGIQMPIKKGFSIRLGYLFSENDLSRKLFMTHTINLACMYAFSGKPRRGVETRDDYNILKDSYSQADESYNQGDFELALEKYNKVKNIDSSYGDVRQRIEEIEKAIKLYNDAMDKMYSGDDYTALSMLRNINPKLKKAQIAIQNLEKKLVQEIPLLEKQAEIKYNEKNYKDAINIYKKILIIDPDNSQALLYLPRAQKRQETYNKLK